MDFPTVDKPDNGKIHRMLDLGENRTPNAKSVFSSPIRDKHMDLENMAIFLGEEVMLVFTAVEISLVKHPVENTLFGVSP